MLSKQIPIESECLGTTLMTISNLSDSMDDKVGFFWKIIMVLNYFLF